MSYSRTKLRFAGEHNFSEYIRIRPRVYFWTLTIAENVTSKEEAERRFKPVKDYIRRRGGTMVGVWEKQERGAWHVHFLTEKYIDVNWFRPWLMQRGWGQWCKVKIVEPRARWTGERWEVDLESVRGIIRYLGKYLLKACTDDYGNKVRPLICSRSARKATVGFKWVPWENPYAFLYAVGRSLWMDMYGTAPRWTDSKILIFMGAEDVDWYATDPWFIPP